MILSPIPFLGCYLHFVTDSKTVLGAVENLRNRFVPKIARAWVFSSWNEAVFFFGGETNVSIKKEPTCDRLSNLNCLKLSKRF